MNETLNTEVRSELLKRGFSRRSFGRFATLMTAGASLPFYNEAALAQGLSAMRNLPPDAVKINANENPLGPCPEAAEAIFGVVKKGGRYLYEETFGFTKLQADLEGLKPNYVVPFAGSSAPLHQAVMAFTSPSRPLVMGDPGYEAADRAAQFVGAKTIRVPLAKDFSHDVKAMVKASASAGVIYICNPNNPTGTMTSRADLEYVLANKPTGSILLLDEAYIHLLGKNLPVGSDLVAADKDVIILRTFSKLYGMAGLRAGAAFGRPDLLAKMTPYGAGALPVTGMVGGLASLKVSKTLVPERAAIIGRVREDVQNFLVAKNISFVPSVSNKIMIDVKRPGREVFDAMLQEKVVIGRTWSAWPNHVRVSIGTPEEMAKFKTAFAKVMGV
ncbi:MAG: pyridoxal phosphate-dependent aminotransferase [Bryobacteraceae bacterium]|nr:pyridoxal phosphate-dependent aminotransferase [Bryobacteraceae bacterium]